MQLDPSCTSSPSSTSFLSHLAQKVLVLKGPSPEAVSHSLSQIPGVKPRVTDRQSQIPRPPCTQLGTQSCYQPNP